MQTVVYQQQSKKQVQDSSRIMNVAQQLEHENHKHICNICEKQTLSRLELVKHQDKEHEVKEFKFTYCGYRALKQFNLNLHKKNS